MAGARAGASAGRGATGAGAGARGAIATGALVTALDTSEVRGALIESAPTSTFGTDWSNTTASKPMPVSAR